MVHEKFDSFRTVLASHMRMEPSSPPLKIMPAGVWDWAKQRMFAWPFNRSSGATSAFSTGCVLVAPMMRLNNDGVGSCWSGCHTQMWLSSPALHTCPVASTYSSALTRCLAWAVHVLISALVWWCVCGPIRWDIHGDGVCLLLLRIKCVCVYTMLTSTFHTWM